MGRAASAIDGGPPQAMQRAAIEVLEPSRADQETRALRQVFARKRNIMTDRLATMGIRCARPSEGTFYVWASVAALPAPFNDANAFFRRALEHQVLTVPGVSSTSTLARTVPTHRRSASGVRFSFGPPEPNVSMGLDRLEAMLALQIR